MKISRISLERDLEHLAVKIRNDLFILAQTVSASYTHGYGHAVQEKMRRFIEKDLLERVSKKLKR